MEQGDSPREAEGRPDPRTVLWGLAVLGILAVATSGPAGAGSGSSVGAVAAPLLVGALAGRRGAFVLVGWIVGGSAVLGGAFWGLGQVVSLGVPPELLLAAGVAVGGGLGGVVRLLGGEEDSEVPDETVTFTRGSSSESGGTPDPRPADLFETSPDPLLYFDNSGDGPVVRAVNPAFESVFGVTSTAVEDAALGDANMVTDRSDAIVRAASTGADFRATVDCETADGEDTCAVRLATVTDDVGVRGYVIYTPIST